MMWSSHLLMQRHTPPSAADEQKIESTPSAKEGNHALAPAPVDAPPVAAGGSSAHGQAAKGRDPQAKASGEHKQQEA